MSRRAKPWAIIAAIMIAGMTAAASFGGEDFPWPEAADYHGMGHGPEQDPAKYRIMGAGPGERGAGLPLMVLAGGEGFAIHENQSLLLRFQVDTRRFVPPSIVRELMASNKTITEIREDLESSGIQYYHGSMLLDRDWYALANISVSSTDLQWSISADVVKAWCCVRPGCPNEDQKVEAIGHIDVTSEAKDDFRTSKGRLEMTGGNTTGTFFVLLVMKSMPEDRAMSRQGVGAPA